MQPGLSLVLVFAGKLVGVAQDDLPLAVFTPIDLGATQRPWLRLITGVTSHVLQVDGVCEVILDDRHDVLCNSIAGLNTFRCPVESGANQIPTALVTAERAHDHHVIGVRPQGLEWFRSSFHEIAQCFLAPRYEVVPVAIHGYMVPSAQRPGSTHLSAITRVSDMEGPRMWWAAVDSNHLPPRYQHGALPVELAAQRPRQDPTPDHGSLVGRLILQMAEKTNRAEARRDARA